MAMFIQYLSAKLGVATGQNLAELCREHYPRPVTVLLWVQAEFVTMATDLAEFVGAAVALNLLFGIPLLPAAAITAVVSLSILLLAPLRRRRFETVIIGLLAIILFGSSTRRGSWARSPTPDPVWCRGSPVPIACCWPPASSTRLSCHT
jgi:manganese transport protein